MHGVPGGASLANPRVAPCRKDARAVVRRALAGCLPDGWLSRGPSSSWRPSWQPSSSSSPWIWLLAASIRTRISRPFPRMLRDGKRRRFVGHSPRLLAVHIRRLKSCERWRRKLSRENRGNFPAFRPRLADLAGAGHPPPAPDVRPTRASAPTIARPRPAARSPARRCRSGF